MINRKTAAETMKKKIELLAPGGDINAIKSAILAGADAVYCGLDRFNARNRAENVPFSDLSGILTLAHQHECEVFITVNILIVESELPAFIKLLNHLAGTAIDGVIVQDLGALYILTHYFPMLKVHASTQLTTHNRAQISFLKKLNATRANLCRELNITEIQRLTAAAHELDMQTEVFVHGANCISFSGLCYLSSIHGGNSGNRGRCSQQCRSEYDPTPQRKRFPLNLKDNSAFDNLSELAEAGVDSLKIEGRIKKFDYVYTVTRAWRTHLTNFYAGAASGPEKAALQTVFNRSFSNGFLTGTIGEALFTDNPRDHSARMLAEQWGDVSPQGVDSARDHINAERANTMAQVQSEIDPLVLSRDSSTRAENISLPQLAHPKKSDVAPALSILISAESELAFCKETEADIYFQLPSSLDAQRLDLIRIFSENPRLIPWSPEILLDDELDAMVFFLEAINAPRVVANNLGLAMEMFRRGIRWIAGPHLNLTNSYSLKCLKEKFGCAGAFVSNELSRTQIGGIKKPADFKMFYRIFHPILLMTSRQCLFFNVTGCAKTEIDGDCLQGCTKTASITNPRGAELILEKSAGNYHQVFNDTNFLNLDILTDMLGRFDGFLIDLRSIKTKSQAAVGIPALIALFEKTLSGDAPSLDLLKEAIAPRLNTPYKKGI